MEVQITDNTLVQKFFYDKKNHSLLTDPMYILYDKFETKLRQYSYKDKNVTFLSRVNDKGLVILIYEINDLSILNKLDKSRSMFKITDFVPPSNSCSFCRYKKNIDENFFYCNYKEKTMTKEIKKCRYFKQRPLYKT